MLWLPKKLASVLQDASYTNQDVPVEGTAVCKAGYPEKARFVLLSRQYPPVARDHGLRLRLMSAASSRLPLESLLTGKP